MKILLIGVFFALVLACSGCGTGGSHTLGSTPQQSSSTTSSSASGTVQGTTGSSSNSSPASGSSNSSTSSSNGSGAASTSSSSTVSSSSANNNALPTPPSTAKVFSNMEQITSGWGSCDTAACAGGNGGGTFWQAFNQTSPSMDGNSMEVYHDGGWSNALWYLKTGADDNVTNFLWDFYVQLDSASLTSAQALEYDAFQFVGGYNYMIGTECNYAAGVWDTWSEANGNWLHTTIPCQKFTPGTWHRIQWYMTANHTNHSYTYVTLIVDGTVYNVNQTQYAKNNGWSDDLGAQWQLDVNAGGGGYHEWVDQATLTVW